MSEKSKTVKTSDLMHEIMLSLTGIDTFFTSKDPTIPNYNKALLEPSEAELLERILTFGKQFGEIQEYINNVNEHKLKEGKFGLYVTAFAEELDYATHPYWGTLVCLEQDILKREQCSLQYVWSKIFRYSDLLSGLQRMVVNVTNRKLRGCLLVQYLEEEMHNGMFLSRNYVQPIYKAVNKVFYHQIFCWMVYGQLVDAYDEFFIREDAPSSGNSDTPFDRFSVNPLMLPRFVTQRFATRILKVGQTVQFLRSNPNMPYHEENIEPSSEICITGDVLLRRKGDRIKEKMVELEDVNTWNERNTMINFLAQVSACVTKELWSLAHKDAKIMDQLRLVKEFFFLGRGELFHEFLVQLDHNFSKGLAGCNESTIDSDLNSILQEACQKIHVKEDFLQRFRLEYKKSGNEEKPMSLGGEWSNVIVKYDIPWPLQILFTPSVLHSYNRIFPFLLRLKKIQVKFVSSWLIEKSKKMMRYDRRRILHRNLWFLINNLQYYLHADVLETQFEIFESAVKYSRTFEDIEKAHTIFLENVISQLFLFKEVGATSAKTAINKNLNKILKICEEFFREMDAQEERKVEMEILKLKNMFLRLESCVECLLKLLTRFSNEESYPGNQYLAQFLLRLDYNTFFSQQINSDAKLSYL